mmetsp:Transcript_11294/g.23803  ORF Transcript_11294/g.23803 Transcript_11294/m.23803 type:complete len:213 (+) Transcript_11294:714-1352(+)
MEKASAVAMERARSTAREQRKRATMMIVPTTARNMVKMTSLITIARGVISPSIPDAKHAVWISQMATLTAIRSVIFVLLPTECIPYIYLNRAPTLPLKIASFTMTRIRSIRVEKRNLCYVKSERTKYFRGIFKREQRRWRCLSNLRLSKVKARRQHRWRMTPCKMGFLRGKWSRLQRSVWKTTLLNGKSKREQRRKKFLYILRLTLRNKGSR